VLLERDRAVANHLPERHYCCGYRLERQHRQLPPPVTSGGVPPIT
jgi:hypothetical protein